MLLVMREGAVHVHVPYTGSRVVQVPAQLLPGRGQASSQTPWHPPPPHPAAQQQSNSSGLVSPLGKQLHVYTHDMRIIPICCDIPPVGRLMMTQLTLAGQDAPGLPGQCQQTRVRGTPGCRLHCLGCKPRRHPELQPWPCVTTKADTSLESVAIIP